MGNRKVMSLERMDLGNIFTFNLYLKKPQLTVLIYFNKRIRK